MEFGLAEGGIGLFQFDADERYLGLSSFSFGEGGNLFSFRVVIVTGGALFKSRMELF